MTPISIGIRDTEDGTPGFLSVCTLPDGEIIETGPWATKREAMDQVMHTVDRLRERVGPCFCTIGFPDPSLALEEYYKQSW